MEIRQQLPLRVGGRTGQACRTLLKKYGTSSPYLTRLTIAAINARFKLADFTGRVREGNAMTPLPPRGLPPAKITTPPKPDSPPRKPNEMKA
jgi:hypothetical protein